LKRPFLPPSQKLTEGSWTAVVRGAVMRGLEGEMVRSRKVARNYGHSYSVAFVKGLHSESDSYIDKYDGTLRYRGQMSWCVKKVKT